LYHFVAGTPDFGSDMEKSKAGSLLNPALRNTLS